MTQNEKTIFWFFIFVVFGGICYEWGLARNRVKKYQDDLYAMGLRHGFQEACTTFDEAWYNPCLNRSPTK